jgi:hypothetical protein
MWYRLRRNCMFYKRNHRFARRKRDNGSKLTESSWEKGRNMRRIRVLRGLRAILWVK